MLDHSVSPSLAVVPEPGSISASPNIPLPTIAIELPELVALAKTKLDRASSEGFNALRVAHLVEARRLIDLALQGDRLVIG